ncbi:CXXC motif containing zinc binding protein isoform X1 [Oncorhynchus keta]|uniref:CXXC motif containing zinc binding protein isoform X1 n=2 Tax=Oncorhynchus keta TaxID=8018 RepID=UPI0015FE2F38|nr:CXXC motif containing zinc binding protein isoform X1 [Oncorhynchus keta]
MVKIGLQFKATLENITNVRPEGEDFRWFLKLKCANCGEIPEKWQYINLMDSVPLKGGRGSASMVQKCKLCARENSIDIMRDTITPYNVSTVLIVKLTSQLILGLTAIEATHTFLSLPRGGAAAVKAEDSERFKTMVQFECRGLEPVDFQPQAGFAAEGAESGTKFPEITLLEKDWTDYDEKASESVGIYEVTHQFIKC